MYRVVLAVLFSLASFILFGKGYHYQALGSREGLSQSSAISIWQDGLGRMWFGNDALNCYDGNHIEVYKLSKYYQEIEDSHIHAFCGNDTTLYFLASNRLLEFDLLTERFTLTDITTKAICYQDHYLYYVVRNTLYRYDSRKKEKEAEPVLVFSDRDVGAVCLAPLGNDQIAIGTESGYYVVDTQKKRLLIAGLENESVSYCKVDSQGHLWLACNSRRIYLISTTEWKPVITASEKLIKDEIYCLEEDREGRMWAGTLSGAYQIAIRNEEQILQVSNYQLSGSFISAIYCDRQGTIWFASYYGDVRYFNPQFDRLDYYESRENGGKSLRGVVLGKMAEDNSGNLYIATEGSGINILNEKTKAIRYLTAASGELPHDKVRSIWYDKEYNRLYISIYMQGLYCKDLTTGRLYEIKNNYTQDVLQLIIEEIIPYEKDLILVTQNGLFRLNRKTQEIAYFFDSDELRQLTANILRTVFVDERDVMWVSSHLEGLITIDLLRNKLLRRYGDGRSKDSLIPSAIIQIAGRYSKGIYFITLRSGLLRYEPEKDGFSNITEEEGLLLSDINYNMTFSWHGNLVVTSNRGLTLLWMSPSGRPVNAYHMPFGKALPLMGFNGDCGLYASETEDRIYAGGLYGMLSFSEKDVMNETGDYKMFFSSLDINNVPVTGSSDILSLSLPYSRKIVLPFNRNSVSLTFATSNYLSSYFSTYEYMLEGLDNIWAETNYNTITYNSLRPGSYTLLVREKANPERMISLDIVVRPPFYASLPALFIYLLLLSVLTWFIVRFYKSRAALRESLKKERQEVERIEMLNRNKLDFFTSISNEFRTPLTLIATSIDRLLHDVPSVGKVRFERIKRQIFRLQELMTELLDFRKIESNNMHLKVRSVDLTPYVQEIANNFAEYTADKEVVLRFKGIQGGVFVWLDPSQMQKVLYNLLEKIIRSVKRHDEVILSAHRRNNQVEMRLDTPDYFPNEEERIHYIEAFNAPLDETETYTSFSEWGIGFAFSRGIVRLHKGNIYIRKEKDRLVYYLSLPLGNSHFKAEELEEFPEPVSPLLPMERYVVEKDSEKLLEEWGGEDQESRLFKMLIIDNDEDVLAVLKDSLMLAYQVIVLKDGNEAAEFAIQEAPDIILCEINVPGLSGLELCEMLKANVNTQYIPIVLLSFNPSFEQKIESIRSGADEYIEKPFDMELLFLQCNRLVRNSKRFRQSDKKEDAELILNGTNPKDHLFMENSHRVITENFSNPNFDINIWSRSLGIGRTRLFNLVKRITGMTPNDYVLQLKMKRAAELLSEVKLHNSISDVAYQLGFTNPAYFSRSFKKQFGVTPREFKDKHEKSLS